MKKNLLFVFGTRPEAIKMAPIIKRFEKDDKNFNTFVCVTAQHREMLDQVLDFFEIKPNFDLNLMQPNQTLFGLTAKIIENLQPVLEQSQPDYVFVQGDTTTAFIGALAGFYMKKKVVHIEAGLRSENRYSPFPEEMNRILAGRLADLHFTPTKLATQNLLKEGITENIFEVGNSVIDALLLGLDIIKSKKEQQLEKDFDYLDLNKRIILITGHRRESFGKPFEDICYSIKQIASEFSDVEMVYPVHLNPNVLEPVGRILKDLKNVHLVKPIDYPHMIWLMNKSNIVLTDSGGIQEEAPSLGKPVLVLREVTERQEGVEAGTAKLVGTNPELIINSLRELLTNKTEYERMSKAVNPYGDGSTSEKIYQTLISL